MLLYNSNSFFGSSEMDIVLIVAGVVIVGLAIVYFSRRHKRVPADQFVDLKHQLNHTMVELYFQEAWRAIVEAVDANPLRSDSWYLDMVDRMYNAGAHSITVNLKEQGRVTCCPFQANFYPDRHTWYGNARALVTTQPEEFNTALATFCEKVRTFK